MSRPHPLLNLYLARLREFYRAPAQIFWVYGFPTVLAVCLGLAFQSRPPEAVQVDLVANPVSAPVEKVLRDYNASAVRAGKPRLVLRVEPLEPAIKRLETGKT